MQSLCVKFLLLMCSPIVASNFCCSCVLQLLRQISVAHVFSNCCVKFLMTDMNMFNLGFKHNTNRLTSFKHRMKTYDSEKIGPQGTAPSQRHVYNHDNIIQRSSSLKPLGH